MPSVKLSFGEILSESFAFFFGNLRLFFHLVTIPWILSIVLRIVSTFLIDRAPAMALVEKAIDVIPTVMFLVAWMRVVLLGPRWGGHLPGLGWSTRETAFLIHLLKVAGMTFVLIAAFTLALGEIDPSQLGTVPTDPAAAQRQALAAPIGIGFMVSAVMALRVSFGLAATALDIPFTPRQSWAFSRGNGWKIVGVLFVILLAGGIATLMSALTALSLVRGSLGASSAAAIVAWTVAILVSYAGAAIGATAQAIIFRRLTGWREGVS